MNIYPKSVALHEDDTPSIETLRYALAQALHCAEQQEAGTKSYREEAAKQIEKAARYRADAESYRLAIVALGGKL